MENRVETPQIVIAHDPEIAALISAESLPENHIEVASDLRGADPLVAATRESLAKREPAIGRRRGYPFFGTSSPMSASSSFISSQTNFFASGFRSRYEG